MYSKETFIFIYVKRKTKKIIIDMTLPHNIILSENIYVLVPAKSGEISA